MFAVVILGIGFILVAAIFPVAIQQTQSNSEESSAAVMAREAANAIQALPGTVSNPLYNPSYPYNPLAPNPLTDYQSVHYELTLPPTVKNYVPGNINSPALGTTPAAVSVAPPAVVVPFCGPRWQQLLGNVIPPSDPRYSYVAFYRRESGASLAQLIVISVANRQRAIYDSADDALADPAEVIGSVGASTVSATITPASFPKTPSGPGSPTIIAPDTISFTVGQLQEGFYAVTPPPGTTLNSTVAPPWNRTYRLGRQLSGTTYFSGTFEMEPADNMLLTAGSNGNGWGSVGTYLSPPTVATAGYYYGGIRDPAGSVTVAVYPTATLQPTVAYAQLQTSSAAPFGQIALQTAPATANSDLGGPPAAAPGAFVIIADDYPFNPSFTPAYSSVAPSTANYQLPPNLSLYNTLVNPVQTKAYYAVGSLNGRIFRLGQQIPATSATNKNVVIYNLDPAYGMRPPASNGPAYSPDTVPNPDFVAYETAVNTIQSPAALCAKVFIVGQGRASNKYVLGGPLNGHPPTYSKGAQDIGVFTTYIPVQ
jgi:hypothetical protein